jgi:hypothetical protein
VKISKERIATLGLGHIGNLLMGKVIDWVVDPIVAFLLFSCIGGVKGFIITWMTLSIISFFACYATLKFYDWSKTDWLGIEAIKTLKELEGNSFKRMIAKIIQQGDVFALIVLSVLFDPFIVVAYMRHGVNKFNGLNKRDWKIFLTSIMLSNGWQTILIYGGLIGIKHFWRMIIS